MKSKLLTILIAMFCDEAFYDHIESEFHCFCTALEDAYKDMDDWTEIIDDLLETAKPYIKIVYKELEDWC